MFIVVLLDYTGGAMKLDPTELPPNTMFLSIEVDPRKCVLLHGTSSRHLARIAVEGLRPREGREGQSNWEMNPSHPEAVYLTTAYALHYANCALGDEGDVAVILDIDYSMLDTSCLVGDEDGYATSTVAGLEWLNARSLEHRVRYWRGRLQDTQANESLRVLGNCAYLGTIPPAAIRGVRLLTRKEIAYLTLGACDPVIHTTNFKLMGGGFQRFSAWLVDRGGPADAELGAWYSKVTTPRHPVMSLAAAVKLAQRITKKG